MAAQGKLAEAETAFKEALAIRRQLVDKEPRATPAGNRIWLRRGNNRVGGVLGGEGRLTEAQAEHEEVLAICRWLAEQDPNNAGWQSDLAAAHNRVGGVLEEARAS